MHGGRVGMGAVDLVNDHNGHQPFLKGLAEHETRLGLRTFKSVHHQQHAVHHLHHTLHFPAEVRVAGGIHNVDRVAVPEDGSILGLDCDSLFTFQVHGIHGAFLHGLVGPVGSPRLQKLVDQGRFPMVNVSDNGEVAELGRV